VSGACAKRGEAATGVNQRPAAKPRDAAAGPAAEPLIALDGVTVRFGRTLALDQATLSVYPGDTVAVVGPDGAGKSTLLRVLAGLRRPDSGAVTSRLSRDALGYAGSSFDLYGDLTVLENLRFFGQLRGMEEGRLQDRIGAMLALTGLKDAQDRLAGRLSGGMKKGLSLACALVHEPALLLLDEPTVGVDPVSRQELWDIIMQVVAGGTATVFTSSYLEEAQNAGRLAAMSGGRLIETTVDQVMAESAGWSAWVVPVAPEAGEAGAGASRTDVRAWLAQVRNEPRVYLRPEGLTVLAKDEAGARELLAATGATSAGGLSGSGAAAPAEGPATASGAFAVGDFLQAGLTRSGLTFEDAFVLLEGREAAMAPAPGKRGALT
jgi:ABC-type multidrug transport system ATPase subunit